MFRKLLIACILACSSSVASAGFYFYNGGYYAHSTSGYSSQSYGTPYVNRGYASPVTYQRVPIYVRRAPQTVRVTRIVRPVVVQQVVVPQPVYISQPVVTQPACNACGVFTP